jgi:hypothetical protein
MCQVQSLANIIPTVNYSTIVINKTNPIVTIDTIGVGNDPKIVDVLLSECSDLIDARYKPYFAKRFYWFEKNSVLEAANLARKEGNNPQRFFSNLVKSVQFVS